MRKYTLMTVLVWVNFLWVIFVCDVWQQFENPWYCVILLLGWFCLQANLMEPRPTPEKTRIETAGSISREEIDQFAPTHYYRLYRRIGWRRVIVEIDDGIDEPDAEIIPVQHWYGRNWYDVRHGMPVLFEYREQVFRGYMTDIRSNPL